jgi:hypothetical protein
MGLALPDEKTTASCFCSAWCSCTCPQQAAKTFANAASLYLSQQLVAMFGCVYVFVEAAQVCEYLLRMLMTAEPPALARPALWLRVTL